MRSDYQVSVSNTYRTGSWWDMLLCQPEIELVPVVLIIQYAHDDVTKWKHFPRYWPFLRGILWWPVDSPHNGQWRGAMMFSLICAWINGWFHNRDAGDFRRHRSHYDVTVMHDMCYFLPLGTMVWLYWNINHIHWQMSIVVLCFCSIKTQRANNYTNLLILRL